MPRRSNLFHYTSVKQYLHAVKRCIAIGPQLPNIASVFEPTVVQYVALILWLDCVLFHPCGCSSLIIIPSTAEFESDKD